MASTGRTTKDTDSDVMQVAFTDVKQMFDELSLAFFTKFTEDQKIQEQDHILKIQDLMKDWTLTISNSTQNLIKETLLNPPDTDLSNALAEAQDRRAKVVQDIKDAHNRQIQILKSAISEERKEVALSQQTFEQTLRTKYDNLVTALQEKVKDEQEARLQRAIEDLERSAKLESERAKQALELQQAADIALSAKFKNIVGDLRKSWEEEEIQRAKFLEERLRGHYSAVLEHMEAQLHMALQLQDEADKRWMEDVQERNRQHIETMKAFEDKCTRLYETRLREYVHKTDEMMSQYEAQLLQTGSTLALEKNKFESKQRRLKLACSKWKVEYQRTLNDKYKDMLDTMEQRYIKEIEELLSETTDIRKSVNSKQQELFNSEKEVLAQEVTRLARSPTKKAGVTGVSLRAELESVWTELNTPVGDRIDALAVLIDNAEITPEAASKYEEIMGKLTARLPISQAMSRKQFLEYKLKIASREGGSENSNPAELVTELNELQRYLSGAINGYESFYCEPFTRPETPATSTTANPISSNLASINMTPKVVSSTYAVNTVTNKPASVITGVTSLNINNNINNNNKPAMAPGIHRKLVFDNNAIKGKLTPQSLAAMKK